MDTVLRLIVTLLFFGAIFKFLPRSQKDMSFKDLLRRILWVKKPVDLSADFRFREKDTCIDKKAIKDLGDEA